MQRRKFFKDTGMIAIGIGVFGKVSWSENRFVGDTATTTDILGPFYRPGSPIRTNINSKGYTGKLFHISGTVFKVDGKTPFSNCKLEVWQCDEHGVYDNLSDDYNYRGMQKTTARRKISFYRNASYSLPGRDGYHQVAARRIFTFLFLGRDSRT